MRKTENLLARGFAALEQGHLPAAERAARRALGHPPRHPRALHLLGLVALRAGKPELAVEPLRAAVGSAPAVADLHNHLAEALRRAGRAEAAVVAARQATRLAPQAAPVWNNLGLAARDAGDLQAAEAALRRSEQLDPSYARARFNLGSLLLGAERYQAAESAMRRAVTRDPAYALAWDGLGAALASLERFDDARDALERALALAPRASTWYHLAQIHVAERRFDQAAAAFDRALACDPAHVEALAAKARMLAEHKRYDEAEALLRERLETHPQSADLWDALGAVAFTRFDFAAAVDSFERALHVDPDRPDARGSLIFSRAEICDWRAREGDLASTARASSSVVTCPRPITWPAWGARARPRHDDLQRPHDHDRRALGRPAGDHHARRLPGRQGRGQHRAIGMPELVAADLDAYQARVLELAHDPDALAALRAELADHRSSQPLFDTPRFVRNLERAYDLVWDRNLRGEPPATTIVEDALELS